MLSVSGGGGGAGWVVVRSLFDFPDLSHLSVSRSICSSVSASVSVLAPCTLPFSGSDKRKPKRQGMETKTEINEDGNRNILVLLMPELDVTRLVSGFNDT